MKLSKGTAGKTYTVSEIRLSPDVKRRFEVLGLVHNNQIEILRKKHAGAMIVKFRGSRYAVGKEFADGIIVC